MYYHYTNIESLLGIVLSGAVRFGSLAFMNDEKEGFDLYTVLADVDENREHSDEVDTILGWIDITIDVFLRFQMAFCASRLKDDISQ